MPVSKSMPYQWYDTPNIRVTTFKDFDTLARQNGLRVLESFGLDPQGDEIRRWPNLRASTAVFKFEKKA